MRPLARLLKKEDTTPAKPVKKDLTNFFQKAEEDSSSRRHSLKSISRDNILSEVQSGIVKSKMNSFSVNNNSRPLPPTPASTVKHAKSFQFGDSSASAASPTNKSETKNVFNKIAASEPSEKAKTLITVDSATSMTLNNDLASKCAAVLKLSRDDFLALTSEEPKTTVDGVNKFSYKELVRRNFIKDYTGLLQNELEKHLAEDEFVGVFQKDSVSFISEANCSFHSPNV